MADRFFGLLLRLLPADFRGDFGEEMKTVFRDESADAAKERRSARLALLTLRDLLLLPPREHAQLIRQDAAYALRLMRKQKGLTTVAVLSLALGIGANAAMFSVVDGVLLRPLPFRDAERLVRLWETNPGSGNFSTSEPNYLDFGERNRVFEQMAAWRSEQFNLTGGPEPLRVAGAAVTSSFFSLLGAAPARGRSFTAEEGRDTVAKVVVLGDGLWRRRFGADEGTVGQSIQLDGESHTIVGVMPAAFQFGAAELWMPLAPSAAGRRGDHRLGAAGRLRPGKSLEQARLDLQRVAADLSREFPDSNGGWGVRLASFPEWIIGASYQRTLLVLLAAVGFVLLIACANVANLLLARGSARQRELAVRAALGASRTRLLRQLLTESVVLSLAGGAAGLCAAQVVVAALRSISSLPLPRLDEVAIDARVFAFTLAVSIASGLLFGLAPGLQLSRGGRGMALRDGARAGISLARTRLRAALAVTEVALAVVLLAGAGLLIRSLERLWQVDPGFQTSGLLAAEVDLPPRRYPRARPEDGAGAGPSARALFVRDALARLSALPGVASCAVTNILPFGGGSTGIPFTVEGRAPATRDEFLSANWRSVSPRFFATAGIPLRAGRAFSEHDTALAPGVAIVTENVARLIWPDGRDPIGQRLRPEGQEPVAIVGVVGDIRDVQLQDALPMTLFFPYEQVQWSGVTFLVRTPGDPSSLAPSVRATLASLDRDLPVSSLRPLRELAALSLAQPRFGAQLLGAFALLALVLAALGVYGILSFSVAQRTQEIGVRLALGARPRSIRGLVTLEAGRVIGIGLLLGLGAALALGRTLDALLFGVGAADPVTFAVVAGVLLAVGLLASLVPASRAARTDPIVALRSE